MLRRIFGVFILFCVMVAGLYSAGVPSHAAYTIDDIANMSEEELSNLSEEELSGIAESYMDKINEQQSSMGVEELKKQQKRIRKKLEEAKKKRKETQKEISDIDDRARKLDSKLSEITDQLSQIDMKISAANDEIAAAQADMDEASDRIDYLHNLQAIRHEQMKQLMVFYYENKGQMDMFTLFVRSSSFAQFINRTEMASALLEYDKRVVEDYTRAEEELQQEQSKLERSSAKLEAKKEELKASQKEMDLLMASVQDDVKENASDRKSAAARMAKYEQRILSLKMDMETLEASVAQAQIEEAKRLAEVMAEEEASGHIEDTAGAYAGSASDVTLLAATIEAEAGNQSYLGKQAVASVVMNRVKSSHFPNTIYGVVTQKQQFASYRSGMVDAYIERGPSDDCIRAAQDAIDGERVGNWLFFMTVPYAEHYGITGYEIIGDHAFFYRWGAN